MATYNQLVRKRRPRKQHKKPGKALQGNPQLAGIVLKTYVVDPKKPNSADRKLARVRLTNGREVVAKIPGEAHRIQEHARVLVQGGRAKDCPGVRYAIIRGFDGADSPVERRKGRSRVGVKRPK